MFKFTAVTGSILLSHLITASSVFAESENAEFKPDPLIQKFERTRIRKQDRSIQAHDRARILRQVNDEPQFDLIPGLRSPSLGKRLLSSGYVGLKFSTVSCLGVCFLLSANYSGPLARFRLLDQIQPGLSAQQYDLEASGRIALSLAALVGAVKVNQYLRAGFKLNEKIEFDRPYWLTRTALATATAYGIMHLGFGAFKVCTNLVSQLAGSF